MSFINQKILLLSPLPPPAGGIGTWTIQYLAWTKKHNISVDIVNISTIGKRAQKITNKKNVGDEIKRSIYIFRELKKKIRDFNPTIVHLNTACGKMGIIRDYLCAKMIKKHNIKLVTNYRCNVEDQIGNKKMQLYFLKRLIKLSDSNLVLNYFSKKYIDNFGYGKSLLLSNFISNDFLIKGKKTFDRRINNIVFIGHLQKSKGVFEIIELAKKHPDIKFLLVGPKSKEVEKIETVINVKYLGVLDRNSVFNLLSKSDIFLFPSHTEGFSNAMLEAMAVGLPIIATNVGANNDMISDQGGFITAVSDVEAMSKAIELMQDPSIRQKMSNWNIEKVKSNYLIDEVMKKLFAIYDTI